MITGHEQLEQELNGKQDAEAMIHIIRELLEREQENG